MMPLWCLQGLDIDAYLQHDGSLCQIGFPATQAEHSAMAKALEGACPLHVNRIARFMLLLQTEPPCRSEAALRRVWAWSAPTLQ